MNSADILRMATEERLPVFSRQKEILAFAELVEQRAAAIEREAFDRGVKSVTKTRK